jgi:predicted DsbA family dithiol-disulfide isomerase
VWLDRVKKVYKDNLDISWKNFSLEQVNSKQGPEWKVWEQEDVTERRSLLSQISAAAARRQGPELYEKYHLALLTARHGGETRLPLNEEDGLVKLAAEVGLDVGRFQEDLKDPELAKTIGKEHEEAVSQGIFGTPTFVFENGGTAYIKTFIPPEDDAVAELEHFVAIASDRNYIGEIKRPQPPWPKGVFD